jgi:anti-sigma regulatory factor (Ser/Thr protein kinase)
MENASTSQAMQPQDPGSLRLSLRNQTCDLAPASERIRAFLKSHAASDEAVYAVETTVEELVTNVIKYGYEDEAQHEILLTTTVRDGRIQVVVEDDGHEFDPTQREAPDLNRSIEEIPIGGLGLHLVRQLADHVSYERVGARNKVMVDLGLHGKGRGS